MLTTLLSSASSMLPMDDLREVMKSSNTMSFHERATYQLPMKRMRHWTNITTRDMSTIDRNSRTKWCFMVSDHHAFFPEKR